MEELEGLFMIAIRRFAIAQIVLGILVIVFSTVSFAHARLNQPLHGLIIPGYDPPVVTTPPPPTPLTELSTAALGFVIIVCAAFQQKAEVKGAGWQIVLGISIASASIILANAYHDRTVFGNIFYLGILTSLLGIATTAIGINQFKMGGFKDKD